MAQARSHDDQAHYWRHPGLPGVELLKAHYVRHTFSRHTHETYTIGVIESGIEEYAYRGTTHRVGPGGIALVEPGEVHTGHAGIPDGWRYRVLYPEVEVVARAAHDLGMSGIPGFTGTEQNDPATAALLRTAHLAAERGDRLGASTLTRQALHQLLERHGRPHVSRRGPARPDSPGSAAEARDLLHANLVDPPRLEELAAAVGSTPFALLRAFRAAYGLPPHAYLNNVRVHHARRLLAAGTPPGAVAAEVGFADQPHLNRHFKRHTGVPPGVFQQGVLRTGAA